MADHATCRRYPFDHVSLAFDEKVVLAEVSFEFRPGH